MSNSIVAAYAYGYQAMAIHLILLYVISILRNCHQVLSPGAARRMYYCVRIFRRHHVYMRI